MVSLVMICDIVGNIRLHMVLVCERYYPLCNFRH